ncbi:MAG: tRNA preQ1(34) S-adenosylmethionine ribosyltransferase-isomerase QueA [Candidatus Omnitrophota bacterium]
MKLSDFEYDLPKELIAQYPIKERDAARLLILNRRRETVEHRIFKDITDYLNKDDLLILNNTKVLPSRILGRRKTGGRVEFLLLERRSGLTFSSLIKPARIKTGERIVLDGGSISCTVSARDEVTFDAADPEAVYALGRMPLPPYIKREPEESDSVYYQTVYAKEPGAVASPTAGLHFTPQLLDRVRSMGAHTAYVTLHVGYGTFKPVKADDIREHKMEEEYFKISGAATEAIGRAHGANKRVIAVGTTSVRSLESYGRGMKEGRTDLFIYPGYEFKMVDSLITNFHLPHTTLFMLVCAFAGEKLIKKAYQEAIDNKYRFYSYGDAMLIV